MCIKTGEECRCLGCYCTSPMYDNTHLLSAESRPSVDNFEGEVQSICGSLGAYRDAPLAGVLECIRHHTVHHLEQVSAKP